MTELLRRFLWSLPLLLSVTLLLFFVLGSTDPFKSRLSLPLFYNAQPISAEGAALSAMNQALAQGPQAKLGKRKLVELGGAALPTILSRLPSMSVSERRQIAEALWPLAGRMGLSVPRFFTPRRASDPRELSTDEKLLFWERYREEHTLDLRPQAVLRLVRRVAETEVELRSADLYAVDTYALPTLVSALGRIRTREDVERVSRLVPKISHVTERSWKVDPTASLDQAREVVTQIRWFFDEFGPQWTPHSRVEDLVARVSQTEFSLWIFRLTRQAIGLDSSSSFSRIAAAGKVSLPTWLAALSGLLILGPTLAATLFVAQLKESRFRLERFGVRTLLTAALVVLLPFVVRDKEADLVWLSLTSLCMGTAFSTFILHRELSNRLDWRTHHVLRSRSLFSRTVATTRWIAPSIPTITPMAVAEAALWVTALEMATSTTGLGRVSVQAVREGDLYLLMLICLALGVATGVAQILADLLLGTPRSSRGGL